MLEVINTFLIEAKKIGFFSIDKSFFSLYNQERPFCSQLEKAQITSSSATNLGEII